MGNADCYSQAVDNMKTSSQAAYMLTSCHPHPTAVWVYNAMNTVGSFHLFIFQVYEKLCKFKYIRNE